MYCIADAAEHWPLLQDFHFLAPVKGVAYLNKSIHVICEKSNKILTIEDRWDNAGWNRIRINGMKNPTWILECPELQNLYVADSGSGYVWKIWTEFDKIGKLCLLNPNDFPVALSLRKTRLLLVWANELAVLCARSSQELKRLSLRQDNVSHALETDRATFILCCSSSHEYVEILEVNEKGELLRNYITEEQHVHGIACVVLNSNNELFAAFTDGADCSVFNLGLTTQTKSSVVLARKIIQQKKTSNSRLARSYARYLPETNRLFYVAGCCIKLFGVRCLPFQQHATIA